MKENNSLLNNLKKDIQKILIFLNNNQNENKENINIKSKEELNNDKKKSNNLLTQNNQLKEDLNNDKEKSFNLFSLKNQGLEIGKYSSLKYESFNNDLNEQKTKSHEIQKNHENLISLLNNNLNENTHPHSNNINDYNDEDIAKSKRKSQKFLGIRNLIFEQDKKIDQELFREYVTIKKNYLKKKASTQMKVNISFSFNLIVFIITIILSIENLVKNERGVLHIFKSIKNDYYSIIPLYNDFAIIDKSLKLIAIRYILNITDKGEYYVQKSFNDLKNKVIRLDEVLDFTVTASYDFSNSFLDYFNTTILFNDTKGNSEILTLENFIWRLSAIIHYIYYDINLIVSSNFRIQLIFENLSTYFFDIIGNVFNNCLLTSLDMINKLFYIKK